MQGDVEGVGDVAVVVFVGAADVEDSDVGVVDLGGEGGEVGDAVAAQRGVVGQGVDVSGSGAGEVVNADAGEFASRLEDLVVVVADEGERGAPGVEPAEVGDEGS